MTSRHRWRDARWRWWCHCTLVNVRPPSVVGSRLYSNLRGSWKLWIRQFVHLNMMWWAPAITRALQTMGEDHPSLRDNMLSDFNTWKCFFFHFKTRVRNGIFAGIINLRCPAHQATWDSFEDAMVVGLCQGWWIHPSKVQHWHLESSLNPSRLRVEFYKFTATHTSSRKAEWAINKLIH